MYEKKYVSFKFKLIRMSKRLLLALGIFCALAAVAQRSIEYPVKAGEIPDKALPVEARYVLPAFQEGTAMFKNKTSNTRLFNFNILLNEMHFISDSGDTLAIAEPGMLDFVKIDSLYFYYDNMYLQKIEIHNDFKLARKQGMVQLLDKKKGAYDMSTGTSSIDAYQMVVTDNSQLYKLEVKKDLLFKKLETLYIGDKYNRFLKASRKAFNTYFDERKVSAYLKSNKVNFNDGKGVKELFEYCATNTDR